MGVGNPALVTLSVVFHRVGNGGFACCLTLAGGTYVGTFPKAKHLLASSKWLKMGNSQLCLAAKILKKTPTHPFDLVELTVRTLLGKEVA